VSFIGITYQKDAEGATLQKLWDDINGSMTVLQKIYAGIDESKTTLRVRHSHDVIENNIEDSCNVNMCAKSIKVTITADNIGRYW